MSWKNKSGIVITFILVVVNFAFNSETCFSQVRKTVAILGDSYSTFEGFIPTSNAIYYTSRVDTSRTDVSDVKQTWWWQVIKEGGFKLGVNDSFSGATISYTGYNDEDYTDRSFLTRLPRLGNPDIIFIFGGINDNWTGAQMGEYKYTDFKRADLFTYRPAVAKLLQIAQDHYPNTMIYFIISDDLKNDVTESTKTICNHYGIKYIQLKGIEKKAGHPTILGMKNLAQQVLSFIKADKL